MRIGILTQALHTNYGGLLQNYALQQVLGNLGHEAITIDRHRARKDSAIKDAGKWIVRKFHPNFEAGYLTAAERRRLGSLQRPFIEKYIKSTGPLFTQQEFDAAVSNGEFEALLVGSDQCWRPLYSANIQNYYLDFAKDTNVRKIVYAASFGVDKWEYSPELTAKVKASALRLDAVSVREKSAVTLCKDNLGIDAQWCLDPTMLIGRKGFDDFVNENKGARHITSYILEASEEAARLVATIRNKSGIDKVVDNLANPLFKRFESVKHHINISVEDWLSNIANADVVVTDSFHGAVFSILFNIPFLVRLNSTRGNARIESLLEDFGLQECICKDTANAVIPEIDWQRVNSHLADRQKESMDFLIKALDA